MRALLDRHLLDVVELHRGHGAQVVVVIEMAVVEERGARPHQVGAHPWRKSWTMPPTKMIASRVEGLVPQVAEILERLAVEPLGLVDEEGTGAFGQGGLQQAVEFAVVTRWLASQVERGEQLKAHRSGGGPGPESDPADVLAGFEFTQAGVDGEGLAEAAPPWMHIIARAATVSPRFSRAVSRARVVTTDASGRSTYW